METFSKKNQRASTDSFRRGDGGLIEEDEKMTRNREIAYERIFAPSIGSAYDTFRHIDS